MFAEPTIKQSKESFQIVINSLELAKTWFLGLSGINSSRFIDNFQ